MLQLVTYLTGTSQQTIPIYVLSLQYYSSSVIALIFCRHFSAYFDVFIYSYFIGSAPMLFHFYFITSQPTIRSLPAAHHGEVCDLSKRFLICLSSVGSYCSQYITISSSFTDAFLPSSLHNTSIRQSFHQVCYRRCLIAGMCQAAAITATSQCLSRR